MNLWWRVSKNNFTIKQLEDEGEAGAILQNFIDEMKQNPIVQTTVEDIEAAHVLDTKLENRKRLKIK